MRYLSQAVVLALSVTGVVNAQTVSDPTKCAKGAHLISAPGKGASGVNGLLQSLIDKVLNGIPNSDSITIAYDKNSVIPVTAAKTQRTWIKQYAASCPYTPIILVSYSVGGIATMDTLCGDSTGIGPRTKHISKDYHDNLIAMTAYGEESWVPGQSYDAGTCKNPAPDYPRQHPAGCDTYADIMKSWCDATDPECCSGGLDPQTHLGYPHRHDQQAYNFIIGKYNAYRQTHPISGLPGLPAAPPKY